MPISKDIVVTHSNSLTEARYSLSVNEQRIVLFMISRIHPQDDEFKDYEINVADFAAMLGIKNKNIYADTKKLLQGLLSKVLYIPNDNGYLMTNWVSSAEYKDDEGVVLLSFDKKLKPYLLMLKEQFTKYKLFTVTQFRSAYSVRLYMLLKQYVNIGIREFELAELRVILGLEKDSYPQFYEFRRRIIKTAQKEFSKKDKAGNFISDLNFDLETITRNRKITRLRFIIKPQATSTQIELPFTVEAPIPDIVLEYEAFGIDRTLTLTELEKQGEKALQGCLELFKAKLESTKLKNPSGYLLGMLTKGAGKKTKAQQLEAERQQKKQTEERQQYLEKQRKKLEEEFTKKAKQDYLDSLTEQQKEELLEEVRLQYADNPAILNLIDDINSPIAEGYIINRIPRFEECREIYINTRLFIISNI